LKPRAAFARAAETVHPHGVCRSPRAGPPAATGGTALVRAFGATAGRLEILRPGAARTPFFPGCFDRMKLKPRFSYT
jgi:hypothetical protein